MEFESDISYEQVKQRLLSKTEPFDFSNRLSENTFLAKWNGNETFYLYKTGGIMSWRPYRVFTGKVSSRDIGSIISGDFLLDKQSKIFLVCFYGFAWIVGCLLCFFNGNFDFAGKLITLISFVLWTAVGYAMFTYVLDFLQRKNQEAVIEFIKENLLR